MSVRKSEEDMPEQVHEWMRNAPIDDEPESAEEAAAVAEAKAWLQENGGKGIPHAEAMRRLGLIEEPVTDEDRLRLHEVRAFLAEGGKGTSMDDFLAEFGMKPEDFPFRK